MRQGLNDDALWVEKDDIPVTEHLDDQVSAPILGVEFQNDDSIAEAEAGGRSAYSSLQSALKNSRQAAKLISGGKIDDARKKNATAKAQLLLAGRAIRRQLENVVLPAGEEGALVSRLLEAEAARLGLIWQTATRGEQFEASSEDKARGLEDMAFPPAYRDLVRIYLRAIRN